MRFAIRHGLTCIALALAVSAPALAAAPADPGREWMLERKSVRKVFVPDAFDAAGNLTGQTRNTSKSVSGDSGKGSKNARSAGTGKAFAISGATSATSRGGNLSVDLSALAARVSNGPVDFGSADGKRVFKVSSAGGADATIAFQAYRGDALGTTIVVVTGRNPSASRNGIVVSVARIARDGNTITGLFEGPNGQHGTLQALN